MVTSKSILYYCITCDKCNAYEKVAQNFNHGVYNGAQAVRSIGWSYGKDGTVLCSYCRKKHYTDRYR